jgi:hypothetical protein
MKPCIEPCLCSTRTGSAEESEIQELTSKAGRRRREKEYGIGIRRYLNVADAVQSFSMRSLLESMMQHLACAPGVPQDYD